MPPVTIAQNGTGSTAPFCFISANTGIWVRGTGTLGLCLAVEEVAKWVDSELKEGIR